MASTIGRGLLAGAVGTTLLNAVSYLDMALTDRASSGAPAETTSRAFDAAGLPQPRSSNQREAYGAVAGIATGLGIGVVASVARRAGVRLPAPAGATVVGALAMAATDVPMAALGVSDPRKWTAADWTRDVVPHLAYGVGVRWALDRTEPTRPRPRSAMAVPVVAGAPQDVSTERRRDRSARSALVKSLVIGVAAGGRSSLGLGAPLVVRRTARSRLAAATLVAGEVVTDKLPTTPSRLEAGPLVGRLAAGAVGGVAVAGRAGHPARAVVGGLLGVAGAAAGSVAGAAWRQVAQDRGFAWPAAVIEDVTAIGLAAYALS